MNAVSLPGAERKDRFRETFDRRKLRQRVAVGIGFMSLFVAYLGIPDGGNLWVGTSLIVAIAMYAIAHFNWRCASCYGHLGAKVEIHYCSQCGFHLD